MSSRTGQKQAARVVREQIAKENRRRRTLWTSAIAVAALVIAGLIGWGVYASQSSGEVVPPPNATATAGITVGSGPVTVEVYEDFICPHCKDFEDQSGQTLDQLVSANKVKIVYYPLAFLDEASSTDYSTRAAAASACADEGGKFREYAEALFARQPAEGSAGLSDGELTSIGTSVGLSESSFGQCVNDGKYKPWVGSISNAASASGVNGTPTVKVNGTQVTDLTPAGLNAAVNAAA
jgi:protein-disulfide isomerase